MKKIYFHFIIFSIAFLQQVNAQQSGVLDSDFDGDGKINIDFSGQLEEARCIKTQTDGKIVVAGISDNEFAVARLLWDGIVDSSFSANGKFKFDPGSGFLSSQAYALLFDSVTNKIIVAGTAYDSLNQNFVLVRLKPNGHFDPSFGQAGIVMTDFGGSETINAIAKNQSGKIIAAGVLETALPNSLYSFALAQYNPDGSLDTGFSLDGKTSTVFSSNNHNVANAIAVQSNDKIIAGGYCSLLGGADYFALARYNTNGTLDNSFNGIGKVISSFDSLSSQQINSVLVLPNTKILAIGAYSTPTVEKFAMIRYNSNGVIDSSFGTNGRVTTLVDGKRGYAVSGAIEQDGKILLTGNVNDPNCLCSRVALVRYNSDGSLDTTFGTGGWTVTFFPSCLLCSDYVSSITIEPDLRILVAGRSPGFGYFVARYLSGLNLGIIDFSKSDFSVLVYPNPLNESATLEYELMNHEKISISLFSIKGELIQTLISGADRFEGKNKEQLRFNQQVKPGNYILKVKTTDGKNIGLRITIE